MTRLSTCFALLLFTAAARAGDAPNTLSPKEIADGWILLFDGATTFGWKIDGDSTIKDGWLRLGGDQKTKATFSFGFRDFDLSCEFADVVNKGGDSAFLVTAVSFNPGKKVGLFTMHSVGFNALTYTVGLVGEPGEKHFIGGSFGPVPLQFHVPAKSSIALRSIKLRPLGAKEIFNGKDLTGWKQHPDRKASVWTVEEGILRVKNGPGDLQTEGKWADFVLQAEIKTHGKALNSGIFFRAIPGDYQNGYEAQIQNAFKDGDRTKPTDFGTGAIYRRVPARKVVSDDNEWFTMTVAAEGKRIATWVNGYMTVDWTDDRPADDNPRKGLRTAAGAISLQGHDPTTDISFRNLRVREIPPLPKGREMP